MKIKLELFGASRDFSNKDHLKIKRDQQTSLLSDKKNEFNFVDEILKVEFKNYYFSNVIARASKTMLECHNSKLDFKKTGTEG